jgi:hypothetical protein
MALISLYPSMCGSRVLFGSENGIDKQPLPTLFRSQDSILSHGACGGYSAQRLENS